MKLVGNTVLSQQAMIGEPRVPPLEDGLGEITESFTLHRQTWGKLLAAEHRDGEEMR